MSCEKLSEDHVITENDRISSEKEVNGNRVELTEASFVRLETLEAREASYHIEHKDLVKEANGHILNLLNWFLMVAAVSITGSFTAGSVDCWRGIPIAVSSGCLLFVSYAPLFVYAWIKVESCAYQISKLRKKFSTLSDRISALREYYIHLKDVSSNIVIDDLLGLPDKPIEVDFHERLDDLDLLIGADVGHQPFYYRLRMTCLSIIAFAYSTGLPYTLYCRVCSPGAHTRPD